MQKAIGTQSSLSDKQFKELQEWWKDNYPLKRIKFTLCLDKRYIDFEVMALLA